MKGLKQAAPKQIMLLSCDHILGVITQRRRNGIECGGIKLVILKHSVSALHYKSVGTGMFREHAARAGAHGAASRMKQDSYLSRWRVG